MINRHAVIDLGTNTFQFCIAEIEGNNFQIIFEKSLAPKLGKGGISHGIITSEAIERAIEALNEFKNIAESYEIDVSTIHAFGTSAIRNAKNGVEFCEIIHEKIGLKIQIIDGDKEAELIASGVRKAVQFNDEPFLIMDIGGGSVEFIIANESSIYWKQSFEIGAQRLIDMFFATDPIAPTQIKRMHDYFDEKLIQLSNAIHQYLPKTLVGSAGSFETLADIYFVSQNPEADNIQPIASELPLKSFYDSYYKFLEFDRTQRLTIPGMIALRVDMIVVGSILIDYIIKTFKIEVIKVSTFALKEGVLAKLAKNEPL
jgi:exopolyphosphatase/guanosine-5'-triphosphate,3'-diphosphate pyrophosphatase